VCAFLRRVRRRVKFFKLLAPGFAGHRCYCPAVFRVGNENCQPFKFGFFFFSPHDPPGSCPLITRWLSLKEAPRIFVGLESGDIVFIKFAFA
jgi:hypothetical protein